MKEIRVALLGYGGIARSHMLGYELIEKAGFPIKRVALCDIDPTQFTKSTTINIASNEPSLEGLALYTDLGEMLAKEEIDTVDVCLPSYLHKEYTIRLLRAGKNVQCEKPMALTVSDCEEMMQVEKESGKKLMIGMCLRFYNPYLALKELIDSGKYGKVLYATMHRLSALPQWSADSWYLNYDLSGGCLVDLGIHDLDMARYLFGDPARVSAASVNEKPCEMWSESRLVYADGKVITCMASWLEKTEFTVTLRMTLEKATVVMEGGKVTVYPLGEESYPLEFEENNYMAEESKFFAETVLNGKENLKNPPVEAMRTIALIERLRESAKQGGIVLDL